MSPFAIYSFPLFFTMSPRNHGPILTRQQGNLIKMLLRNMGYSQKIVADEIGYPYHNFESYINGQTKMPVAFGQKLYKFLDEDPRSAFLVPSLTGWEEPFDERVGELKGVYDISDERGRSNILADLLRLAEKYRS